MIKTNEVGFRKQYFTCCGAAALFFLLGLLFLNYVSVGGFEDDAIFVGLGDEIVSHFQYRIPCFPSGPLCGKFPPLYPLLLGLFSLPFPSMPAGLPFLKAASLTLAVPGIFFFALWVFKRFAYENIPVSLASLTIFIVAIHADILFMSRELMSDSLFMTLIMIGLWKADSINGLTDKKALTGQDFGWLFLIGVLLFYTRTIGIIFIFSLCVYAAYRRQIRLIVIPGLITAFIMIPWFWWSKYYVPMNEPMVDVIPYFVSYGYHMEAIREFFFDGSGNLFGKIFWYAKVNFVATLHAIESMLFPTDASHSMAFTLTSLRISSFFTIAFVCVGLFRSFRNGEFLSFFTIGYLLLVVVWPWSNKLRFMVPVAPVLVFYFLKGVMIFFSRIERFRKIMPILLCSFILLSNLLWSFRVNVLPSTLLVRTFGTESKDSVQKDALLRSIDWVNENVPQDAVMLVSDGGLVYSIHTGRQALPYRELIYSPSDHLRHMYDLSVKTSSLSLTTSVVERINTLFPGRQLYQLGIFSKKYLADSDILSDVAGVVFADNEKEGKAVVIRKLYIPLDVERNN